MVGRTAIGSGENFRIGERELMETSLYETPELTELGVLNVDTLSGSMGKKKKKKASRAFESSQKDCNYDSIEKCEEIELWEVE